MKICLINTVDYGSTGKIMMQLKLVSERHGFVAKTFSRCWFFKKSKKNNHTYFGLAIENLIHRVLAPLIGCESLLSFWGTYSLCRQLLKNKIELIHLHNIHGYYFCFPLFFKFVKKHNIPVIWTLHDCWSFTGRCPHFVLLKCERWKKGCHDCPCPCKSYPAAYIDNSRKIWMLKKKFFTGVKNMTLVTPSKWLANLVKQSFLKDYPVRVINNGIDLTIFKPTESNFRSRYGLWGKKVVLGVAFGWGVRKGLDVFIELSRRLPKDYRIVLVGTNDQVDVMIPANIISIHRTQNQTELAEIYTAVDVYANPTREDTYPTVNMEALACGTPVVTFRTGGSPEILNETCGAIVPCDDIDAMEMEIRRICDEKPYSKEACLAWAQSFDMDKRFEEYMNLYKKVAE